MQITTSRQINGHQRRLFRKLFMNFLTSKPWIIKIHAIFNEKRVTWEFFTAYLGLLTPLKIVNLHAGTILVNITTGFKNNY